MEATIDGRPWRATAALDAGRSRGLLAVSGCDGAGRALAFAVQTEGGVGLQVLGATPANALLTIGRRVWKANAALGAGSITLSRLTERRATGTFEITAARPGGAGQPPSPRIIRGRFDVAL
jgi:hypothetical protein